MHISVNGMPPRNPRKVKAGPKSPTRGARSKRQRLVSSPEPELGDQGNNRDLQQKQAQNIESDTNEAYRSMNWAAIVANVAEQPYPSQIQQYKEWRRAGSKREDYCCICRESERLENCHTCRLAFHHECLPSGCVYNSYDRLFCSICVHRGWDKAPPVLTPPASPQPAPAQIHHPPGHATSGTNSNAASIPHLLCPAPSLEPQREGLETQSAPEESEPSAIDKNTGHEVTDLGPAVQTATEGSQPTRRQRKSRYSTLPSNVDASLAVLYQELESVAMLRAEIEKLRTQNTQYAQTIKIQEQNQIALRRDLGALRENVTNSESTTKEIRELRERNAALEAELLVSKEQTAAAKELKERLAQLLNT